MITDHFNLTGMNALVTGSTRGLGAAIAIALAEAGANVAVHGASNTGEATSTGVRQRGEKPSSWPVTWQTATSAPRW